MRERARRIGPPGEVAAPVKIPVEKCVALDLQELKQAGYLAPGPARRRLDIKRGDRYIAILTLVMGEDGFSLEGEAFPSPGTRARVDATVHLVRTPALNHGERLWFSCPACNKRVRKLYLPPGQTVFRCRHCHNLTYQSRQKEPNIWRKGREETPKLLEVLANPRMGFERRMKAAAKLERLHDRVVKESAKIQGLIPPGLLALVEEYANRPLGECLELLELPELLEEFEALERFEAVPPPAAPPAPAPAKRPRGRPKEKRPYARHKPFHESERQTRAEAFCVKCRAYREPREWRPVTFRNGRPALQGVCPVCGTKMARIISARLAELLASIPVHNPQDASFFGFVPPADDARW
jgi:hypothetical protein